MRVVGDLIGQVAQLRLQARLRALDEAQAYSARLALQQAFGVAARAVFENAFARLEAEVEPVVGRVALFEPVDHAQALQVVLEARMRWVGGAQAVVERVLAGMAEWRVAQVMRQRDGFDQIFIQPEFAGDRAAELGHFERMGQPGAKQVALVVQEDLGLVDQAPERRAVDDAVAVALELIARGGRGLGVTPAARLLRVAGVRLEHHHAASQAVWASMTAAAIESGAARTPARPGASITTKRISPPSAFLSTRISSR